MEQIKTVGDKDPNAALMMLDSLAVEIKGCSEYANAKYDLLRVRLNDKAYNMPTSDIQIRNLVRYFEKEGTLADKQEVCYYAGSVYRDLQDNPRGLEYFFKSLDYAAENEGRDSMMLRNTYSNLNYLYYRVQDYGNALEMACKELEMTQKLGANDIISYMHLGAANLALDSLRQAKTAFDTAFSHIVRDDKVAQHQGSLVHLLCDYSDLGELSKAKECLALIKSNPSEPSTTFASIAFAQYYETSGNLDSAEIYCKRVFDDGTDAYDMYDAAKMLFRIYNKKGDTANANHYAARYIGLSDSLDMGKRQEQAASVNNMYQYHSDKKREQRLKDEKDMYKNILAAVSLLAILLAGMGYIYTIRKRNRQLQKIVELSEQLRLTSDMEKQLRDDIAGREQELDEEKAALKNSLEKLDNIKLELQRVNRERAEHESDIKAKERKLSEAMEQNKELIRLLHKSELDGKSEDVIKAIEQSVAGRKEMTQTEWRQLYQAVDRLYPSFNEELLKETGSFSEMQMKVCYLMRIGLSNSQIQNITGLSRSTVWRWTVKYDWAQASDAAEALKDTDDDVE